MGARKQARGKGGIAPPYALDPEEAIAVDRATEKLKDLLPGCPNPRAVVEAVISAWIVERVRLSIGRVLGGDIAYSLGDAHLRGSLEAALPQIAEALSALPSDVAFFDLSKDQVIDVLAVGFHAGHDAGALFEEEVPFP